MDGAKASRRARRDRSGERVGRRGDERGASLLEFAFVVPILALLVFGVIDFGMALSDSISQRHGVRDAGRQIAVGNWEMNTSCPIVAGPADNELKSLICLTKDRVDLDADDVRVRVQLGNGATPYTVGEAIAVCSAYPLHSTSGFFGPILNGRYLKTKVVMRIETLKAGVFLASGGEPDPTSSNWSWCTT